MRDQMYDWDENGFPGEFVFEDGPQIGYEEEKWKRADLPGILVSDCGRFYDEENKRFVKPTHGDRIGHKSVKITRNGEHVQKYAHRLIAEAFIPNPDNLPIVRHLNNEPDDNVIENLAWGTQSDNVRDALSNGRTFTASPEVKDRAVEFCRRPVKAIRESDGEVSYHRSIIDSARATGAQQANVSKVLAGSRPRTVGYRYEYISKEEYNAKTAN